MEHSAIEPDILVVGGGMAGLTAAARAVQLGASVVVVEITDGLGGSAALSGGFVWTAPSREAFLDEDPGGDPERFALVLEGLDRAFEWVDALGIRQGPPQTGIKWFGVGRQIDIGHYVSRLRAVIESGGGWIVLGTAVEGLLVEGGTVVGARLRSRTGGDAGEIRAGVTVLATGGFQADATMRERYIAPGAGALVVRSHEYCRGDGIRLGRDAGGALTRDMDGYYGHLIPYPLDSFEPADHVTLAQYHSEHALLLDKAGRRVGDESLGDHVGAQDVGAVGSALMVIDERIRREHVLTVYMSGVAGLDKLAVGAKRGAHYATEDSLEAVADAARAWGYDPAGIVTAVEEFNAYCRGERDRIDPPRKRFRAPIAEPPFAVLEVQSAITFTYGGLQTDPDGRVLSVTGEAVPGLYATGVDAGGLNRRGYTGGLIRGLVLGRRLGEHLAADRPPAG